MVLGHTRLGTLVATAFAVFMALQLRGGAVPAWLVDGWLVVKLGVAAARIYISLRYDRWAARAVRAGAASPTPGCWPTASSGASAGLLLMSSPIPLASLVGAVMACVSCVATFGLQFSKRSTAAYVVPMLALSALGLFLRGDEFGSIGGTGLLMLLGLLLATARGLGKAAGRRPDAAPACPGADGREGRGAEAGAAPERGEDAVHQQRQPRAAHAAARHPGRGAAAAPGGQRQRGGAPRSS